MSTAARTEVVSGVLDRKDLCYRRRECKTTDEVGVYYPQTDSWAGFFFCPKEQIMLPLLPIIVNICS